jgi:glycosyltransferase involved in cell wall biosynthesis
VGHTPCASNKEPTLLDNLTVSVITAVRNGVDVVGRTIDSVKEQTFQRIEHVVVDGASTDGTTEYLANRRSEIHAFQSQPDSGVYDAFNSGLALATGDIVGFLNAGDVFTDDHSLESIASCFKDPSVDAVFGDVAMTSKTDLTKVIRLYRSNDFRPRLMRYGFMPAHPTVYLRRSIYDSLGKFDTSYKIAGDFEYLLRVFLKRRAGFAYIPRILVHMPVGGLSNQGWRSKWQITMEMKTACMRNQIKTSLFRLCLRLPIKTYEQVRFRLRQSDA